MKKIIFAAIVVLLLSFSLVNAITQQEINEAKSLVDSKADCESLSDSQLEIIGEYYMEQMHPGEAHELMHKMMGLKEGSEAEEQFHINMAKTLHCNENTMMGSGGMMNMMAGGMMGSGMVGMMQMMNGYGSSYSYGSGMMLFSWIIWILVILLIIAAIYWLIKSANRKR